VRRPGSPTASSRPQRRSRSPAVAAAVAGASLGRGLHGCSRL
jgi:hypothetical protein